MNLLRHLAATIRNTITTWLDHIDTRHASALEEDEQ